MKKPRVAVIGLKGLPAYGGAAAVGENIIDNLKDQYNFTVFSVSSHTKQKTGTFNGYKQIVLKKFPLSKLNVIYYNIASSIIALFKSYDFVHVHHTDIAAVLIILRIKYRVIITSHGSQYQRIGINFKYSRFESKLLLLSEKYFLKLANIITCVSKSLSSDLEKRYDRKIHYIPNGFIPIEKYKIESYMDKINYKDFILFAAGRIIPTKGCHIFLEALHQIQYKKNVVVVGDLDQVPEYKNRILHLSNGLNVHFTGLIKEKEHLFSIVKKASLFVFPSSLETMSMMLLEVASLGCPIISSDIKANIDVFNDEEVTLFNVDNVSDLASKLLYYLHNKNECDNKAIKAYNKLKTFYRWSYISNKYNQLYNQLK